MKTTSHIQASGHCRLALVAALAAALGLTLAGSYGVSTAAAYDRAVVAGKLLPQPTPGPGCTTGC